MSTHEEVPENGRMDTSGAVGTDDEATEDRNGRIVTFYSYKGGTGRSMAVANVAWILASQGRRVLVIDWDLEAPGLHRYFHPYVADTELVSSPGIIDFLTAFVEGAHQADPHDGDRWFEAYTDLEPYTFSLDWEFPDGGTLDVVPAGQQGPSYATRVTGFNWQGFYERLGGGVFLEAVKRELRREYDWILVDSRTGISDTSGICTVQLPDDLVVCFTLNDQSMTGAAAVTRSVVTQRTRPDGTVGLRVFPVCTRVERAETKRLNAAKDIAIRTFTPFLAHVPEEAQVAYWGSAEVLYHPFYAYEEVLAPFGDPPQESGSMLSAMETLAGFLTDGAITRLGAMDEELRLKERDRFLRQAPAPTPTPLEEPASVRIEVVEKAIPELVTPSRESPTSDRAWSFLAYLSYARVDADSYLERFIDDFRDLLTSIAATPADELIFSDLSLSPGLQWADVAKHAIETSRTCVALYSPAYFRTEFCGKEFAAFLQRGRRRGGPATGIVPVLWGPPLPGVPDAVRQIQHVGRNLPEEYGRMGLKSIIRRSGRRGVYYEVLEHLALLTATTAADSPLPTMSLPPLETLPSAFGDVPGSAGLDASMQVVYVVGDRDGMRQIRRDLEPYGDDPLEWRPFRGSPIHAFAEKTAAAERLFLDVLPFDPDFFERIVEAEHTGAPIAVLVDPWALEIPSYAKLLGRLNERLPRNLAVFVLWDSTDETREHRSDLQARCRTVFSAMEGSDGRRFQPRVESEGAFTRAFASTLVRMSAELQAARNVFSSSSSATLSQAF